MRGVVAQLLLLAGLVTVVACGAPARSITPSQPSGEIVVFAASSLTDVFRELGQSFADANPTARVTFNFGSSSQLSMQLAQGARADVFASADQAQMDSARKADALDGEDRVFAHNRLVLIVPRDNPRKIVSVDDLARNGVKFVTAQSSVPIGQYTLQMLEKASTDPSRGADFKERVDSNVVSREDNVRQVVSKIQLGEADAAVVYATDVTPQLQEHVQQIPVPESLQSIASYPIAVARGTNPAGGEAFMTFVLSPAGQAILARWGFVPANATAE
jgi:molybdate transport system substrate-binding protein